MGAQRQHLLVFTDLDGTLLDHSSYSYEAALPSLGRIRECGFPLVMVSSKTRVEIETMTDLRILSGIFVTENGSAIFLDRHIALPAGLQAEAGGDYNVIILGRPYHEVLHALRRARNICGACLKGFSDMAVEEVSRITGLSLESAARAKQREFSEPFLFEGNADSRACIRDALAGMGMTCLDGGRLFHAMGKTDKGTAALLVRDIFRAMHPDVSWKTVALGDGPNDEAMLKCADTAIVIRRPDGSCLEYAPERFQRVIIPSKTGPEGWNDAVLGIIREWSCRE